MTAPDRPRYTPPPAAGTPAKSLVLNAGSADELRFEFYDRLEIGRDDRQREEAPGLLLVPDPTVSRCHCVLTQAPDGRCFVRDVSRNGTRLDGRRLVPNVENEIRVGQTLALGAQFQFVLAGHAALDLATADSFIRGTIAVPGSTVATVLVGDIRDFTVLVRRAPSVELQQSVNRVFEVLTGAVVQHGGTVKEFPGDAIVAFWEGTFSGTQAVAACRAVLALDRLAHQLAGDQAVWQLADFPLKIDWALATGPVVIDAFGGSRPTGLSLIGEPVVLAFRLEKFASTETARILVCPITRDMAKNAFSFKDLGEMTAKGFDRPDRVFALEGPVLPDEDTRVLELRS